MFVSAYSAQFSSYSLASSARGLPQSAIFTPSEPQITPPVVDGSRITFSQASLVQLDYASGVVPAESAPAPSTTAIAGADKRVEAAAGTIVSFIGQRLAEDLADGATQEELQSRLQAGLEGFLQGFGEASNQLQGLGQLSPEIGLEIQATFDRVIEGLDALSQKYLDGEYQLDLSAYRAEATESPEPVVGLAVADAARPSATPGVLTYDAPSLKAQAQLNILKSLDVMADVQQQIADKAAERRQRYDAEPSVSDVFRGGSHLSYQALQGRSFAFQLTTEEGDIVTINASSASAYSAAANYQYAQGARGNGVEQLHYREQSAHGQQFSFTVDGELNEDELRAINSLLGDVTNLASVFYSGDVEGAFEQAISLGYDDEQIAAFSLNLTQVSVQKATQQYGAQQDSTHGLGQKLAPVGEFAKGLQSVLETLQHFDNQRQLLLSLLGQAAAPYEKVSPTDAGSAPSTIADFAARLLDTQPLKA